MRILVLGAEGMAGHICVKYLSNKYDVTGWTRKNLDVEKYTGFPLEFDTVINCIGVLGPDADKDPARTVYINGYLPHLLSKHYKVIHISTDCVFNGKRGNYMENDTPDETNIYGRSKAMGELINDKDITLRVSIIGPEIKAEEKRSGLFNWIVSNKETQLNGWTNAFWNGITTLELAKCIDKCLQNSSMAGIYHPVNESIDKYNLLCKINDVFNLNKKIVPIEGPKTINKILVNTKGFFNVSSYDTQLEELKAYL